MVANGKADFVGSDPGRARQAIAAAGHAHLATISLARAYMKANKMDLRVAMTQLWAEATDYTADVWLAATEDDPADE